MDKALGFVEYSMVPTGITAADAMVKTAAVDILQAATVCPGKYIVLICGDLSAVKAAIEKGTKEFETNVIDSFILGNPHDSIYKAISAVVEPGKFGALGMLETYSAASIIVAADTAAKTAKVDLLEIRIARGMCGKSYLIMTGDVGAVEASLEAACKKASESGMLLDKSMIANPDAKVWQSIL
jgi:microcompartment protein CcmL/EutN